MIKVLSKDTIDKIAAGEVIERPMSVVKELVENSVDAGSTSITVEIKNGGIDLIRVTDNGSGINANEVRTAFLRHATGKISDAADLEHIHSLGFRGEALSSIAAVSRCEIITKTRDAISGVRYVNEGGNEISFSEIGAPDGTSFIARDLFYNIPARKKFLKTGATEGSHIAELVQMLALSHPDVSFKFISNNQTRLYTSGNGSIKDIIYQIYGRDITNALIEVDCAASGISINGYIAKPEATRPNRTFENYFVNGRYIKSTVVSRAIEDGYEDRMMQHQFPFAVLLIETDPAVMDVNVHPTKMDVRFAKPALMYDTIFAAVKKSLTSAEIVPRAEKPSDFTEGSKPVSESIERPAEPFERVRSEKQTSSMAVSSFLHEDISSYSFESTNGDNARRTEQMSFNMPAIAAGPQFRIVGQVFATYWIIEMNSKMYILDQHAAHEKIYYERLLKQYRNSNVTSQLLSPPMILTLSDVEGQVLQEHIDDFAMAGYEVEDFGGNEVAIRAVPDTLPSVPKDELFKEMITEFTSDVGNKDAVSVIEKTASMACKAAIKGNQNISYSEATTLIKELLGCDNPYNCPHGRPTMIEYTKGDLEKKFKRIV